MQATMALAIWCWIFKTFLLKSIILDKFGGRADYNYQISVDIELRSVNKHSRCGGERSVEESVVGQVHRFVGSFACLQNTDQLSGD